MFDFIRIACAVPHVAVGNVEKNCGYIIEKMREAREKGADITVFPELCVTGYTCQDLFFQSSILQKIPSAIANICAENKKLGGAVFVGAPLYIKGSLYNCAIAISGGKIAGIVPKTFLPNYAEYYEKRWFATSEDLGSAIIKIDGSDMGTSSISVGKNIIITLNSGVNVGIEICEDLWAPISPSQLLALNGAEIIVNLSAGNETVAKRDYRRSLVVNRSASSICAYAYVCAGADESTQDLIFPGHSIIAENGILLEESENRILDESLIVTDIDIGRIRADRIKNQTFKDAARIYGKYEAYENIIADTSESTSDGSLYKALSRTPFVPYDEKKRYERCMGIFDMQVSALKKRLKATGCKAVVGVSGGLDSTLALLVAVEATKRLNRPLSDVHGITMPCFGTTNRTYNNSIDLMKSLGVTLKEINIKNAVNTHFADIGHDSSITDLTFENSQARERTQVLMDYSGKIGGLVVGTGDLSELALGWCTYNADQMSMYGVNVSIPKTLVRWMIDSIVKCGVFPNSSEILVDVLDTPVSPELLPPNENGEISQQTEDIVGPYELHDFFLYHLLRFGFSDEKILMLANRTFKGDYSSDTIEKWYKIFRRRFTTQQFKRSCMPDGVKIGSISLSPRGDLRMPSDSEWM